MKTKTKLTLGITFLFMLIIAMGAASIYYIRILARDTADIIKDNQLSIDYMEAIQNDIDSIQQNIFREWPGADNRIILSDKFLNKYISDFKKNLQAESEDITEDGEKEAVDSLTFYFNRYNSAIQLLHFNTVGNKEILLADYTGIKVQIHRIYQVNQKAIWRKNKLANQSASSAISYISIIGTILLLLAFVFIINFPGYIANPIKNLSDKIRAIADGDFSQRLEMEQRSDEFGLVADSFNYLARKLQEFKESNIAEITTQKTRVESIVNSLDEAIILMDENNKVIAVNPLATELLGMRTDEILGRQAEIIAGKNDLFRAISDSDPTSGRNDKEPFRITLDNQENYFQKYIHPIYQYDEWKQQTNPAGYLIVLKNITEFKKLDIAKTNFMATLSHELKTPLSSINLSLKLISDARIGTLDTEQAQLIDNIRHESNRLLRYVNELLDLSQIETGNIKLNISKISPAIVVSNALEAMKPILEQKHNHVETSISADLPLVNADLEKTVWVMTNLLTNASRYSPEGSSIFVSAKRENHVIRFIVKDEGPGIDPRYHDKIFERFVQIYNTENKGGTGLGLAIAKDFIDAQGGKIWVESAPGEGSSFIFELPVS